MPVVAALKLMSFGATDMEPDELDTTGEVALGNASTVVMLGVVLLSPLVVLLLPQAASPATSKPKTATNPNLTFITYPPFFLLRAIADKNIRNM
jgi:hypothetical protein